MRLVTLSLLPVPFALAVPTVTVLNGTYEGYHLQAQNQDVFLGMPYAQPPVDGLRFREPQSLNSTWTGTRRATEYGSVVCCRYDRRFYYLADG
jgi:carboxylesterase type B